MSEELNDFMTRWFDKSSSMLVHTSGSTGSPKAMLVSKKSMVESAKMTIKALGLNEQTIGLLNLPIKYISGQMMVIRSIVGSYHLIEGSVSSHPLKCVDSDQLITFAAMTPMQVYNTSLIPEEWAVLETINTLIIGGGAISTDLETKLQAIPTQVYATYGMTETLSHIALRRVNGPSKSAYFVPLEGVRVSLDSRDCLQINAPKICPEQLITNDIIELRKTEFRFIGRLDNVINSGGIKIQIEELEQKILVHFQSKDMKIIESNIAITFIADPLLGEMVVLLDSTKSITMEQLSFLDSISRPKEIIPLNKIPLTRTNKINRKACQLLAEKSR